MKRLKNGRVRYDADDMRALQVPPEELTEGQVAFLQAIVATAEQVGE